MAQVNYTPEMTAAMVENYKAGMSVDQIANDIGKSVRSVRSKLVREGVYVAKPTAAGMPRSTGPTKKELLRDLEATGFDVAGVEGATKDAIVRLIAHFSN